MSGVITDLYQAPALTVEGVIQECTRIIERNETVAGVGRRMRNPMLSIFLGRQAVAHKNEIQEAYYSCWSDHAKHLKAIEGAYTRQNIEDAIFQSTQVEDRSLNLNTVRTVWFWDIMDDDFDRHFACVKEDYSVPVATNNKRTYFIFCSQRDSVSQKLTEQRLKEQLIPWAQQTKNSLVVLSDATSKGLLRPSGVAENYRLAASLTLIMNTYYEISEDDLGRNMSFALENETVFSAAYHGCSKNAYDIVSVSLLTIISEYRKLGKEKNADYSQSNSVQNRLCGTGRTYYDLIDDIFNATLMPVCQADARIWNDMPYTEALDGLRAQISQGGPQKQGFFGKLFGGGKHVFTAQEAIGSLNDFWRCTVDRYYIRPVEAYMASAEGQKAVKDHLYACLTSILNYDEMHELLAKESSYVESINDALETKIKRPEQLGQYKNAGELLQAYALYQVRLRVSKRLLTWLSEAMSALCVNASGFDELLKKVQDSIREDSMERSIVRAYRTHMEQLIEQNPQLLSRYIRPSKNEGDLLSQLKDTFVALIAKDPKQVYYKSLQGDLQFRIENGGAAEAQNVIADCFKFDLVSAGRLPVLRTRAGMVYTIMNSGLGDIGDTVADDAIGKRFLVSRSDRIERLYLFPVDPEYIMYTNNL